jgi:hypothetical protein
MNIEILTNMSIMKVHEEMQRPKKIRARMYSFRKDRGDQGKVKLLMSSNRKALKKEMVELLLE